MLFMMVLFAECGKKHKVSKIIKKLPNDVQFFIFFLPNHLPSPHGGGGNSKKYTLYTPARKLLFSLFFPVKADSLILESQTQAKKISVVLLSSPIKM